MFKPIPHRRNGVALLLLLTLMLASANSTAQDLSLQLFFPVPTVVRGDAINAGFIVENSSTTNVNRYRVSFYGSQDLFLDDGDRLLGTFESTEGIPEEAFRENSLALDSCLLDGGIWTIIGQLEDIDPKDPNPLNNTTAGRPDIEVRLAAGPVDPCELSNSDSVINAGLNDAWFNPETPGQGVLLTVFPESRTLFLAWFTFEAEEFQAEGEARLGDARHRWLTASGSWEGNRADLTLNNSTGGIFDSPEPTVETITGYGEVTLQFEDCENARMSYEIPSSSLTGEFALVRAARDNVLLCELLAVSQDSD